MRCALAARSETWARAIESWVGLGLGLLGLGFGFGVGFGFGLGLGLGAACGEQGGCRLCRVQACSEAELLTPLLIGAVTVRRVSLSPAQARQRRAGGAAEGGVVGSGARRHRARGGRCAGRCAGRCELGGRFGRFGRGLGRCAGRCELGGALDARTSADYHPSERTKWCGRAGGRRSRYRRQRCR